MKKALFTLLLMPPIVLVVMIALALLALGGSREEVEEVLGDIEAFLIGEN